MSQKKKSALMLQVNMPDFCMLGPRIEDQTADSFMRHVQSLQFRRKQAEVKVKKPKRVPLLHDLNATSKRCNRCGKRTKSVKAICTKVLIDTSPVIMIESLAEHKP